MSAAHRTCPECGTTYYFDETRCDHDGATLVALAPAKAPGGFGIGGAGVLALCLLVLAGGGLAYWAAVPHEYRIHVVMNEAHGLHVGDRVYVLDADRGTVERVAIQGGRCRITLRLEPDAAEVVKTTTRFHVTYDEILKNKMCMTSFTPAGPAPRLRSGAEARGIDSPWDWYSFLLAHGGADEALRFFRFLLALGIDIMVGR